MTLEELARVKSTLFTVLQLPLGERPAFLEKNCADPELRMEVEKLVALNESAGDFMIAPLPELFGVPSRTPTDLPSGTILKDRYRIEGVLATSGFASVYKAKDQNVAGKLVVIKVLDKVYRANVLRTAFQSELHALSRLRHPNIVGVSDVGELENGVPFLVLDYIDGINLRQVLQSGPLRSERANFVIASVGLALSAAHRSDVLHLDIKPENIILSDPGSPEERVTLIDFGISGIRDRAPGLKGGSPPYMAPEQEDAPSERSDLYALARIACEVFSGSLPLENARIADTLRGTVSRRQAAAIAKALQPDPADRQSSIAEFTEALADQRKRGTKSVHLSVLAIAATAAVAVFLGSRSPRQGAPLTPQPFVATPGFNFNPSFTPDGRWLFFVSGLVDQPDIYRRAVQGGDPILVAGGPNIEGCPEVSPDGITLAFVRGYKLTADIVLKPIDNAAPERVLLRDRTFGCPAWTPDGKQLVLGSESTSRTGNEWRFVDVETGMTRQIQISPDVEEVDLCPAFSPDGKRVAFVRQRKDARPNLIVRKVDTKYQPVGQGDLIPLRKDASQDAVRQIQWTPDGKDLIFVTGLHNAGRIWRSSPVGNEPQELLPGASRVGTVAIPRNAWMLAYSINYSDTNIWRLDLKNGRSQVLIAGSFDDEQARRSPDGKWMIFGSGRSGSGQIFQAKPDGSDQHQITFLDNPDALEAIWTRDSKELIISVQSKHLGMKIYRMRLGQSSLVEIRKDGMAMSASRDGRWIYFRRRIDGGPWQIWRMELSDPANVEQVTEAGGFHGVESLDGRSLYFTMRDESEGLWEMPLPHGPPRKLIEGLYRRNLFAQGKTGMFYVASSDGDTHQALWFRRSSDGRTSLIHQFERQVFWGLDLAPDEQSILYSQYDGNNAVMMLIKDFH